MSALGIVFSNIHNETVDELTRRRTSASIPFGGRYRLIDFTLSNFINSDIETVGVLAQKNYQSLMDHVGSGKDWDLSRKNGGLVVFPPFGYYKNVDLYSNRLEALKSVLGYLGKRNEEYVVLTDCDSVNVIDYADVIEKHEANNADITIVYINTKVKKDLVSHMAIKLDKDGRVADANLKSKEGETQNVAINVWVINRKLLQGLIQDATLSGVKSFEKDILLANIKSLRIYGYEYTDVYLHMNNMENYFRGNMQLLNEGIRNALFANDERRIYTKVRDSAPTRYGQNSEIENSFIADGCDIQGKVENCILFRGVKIGKGAVVKNSILMQDTIVGAMSNLDHVVSDKNVLIKEKSNLSGCEKVPYYLGKDLVI